MKAVLAYAKLSALANAVKLRASSSYSRLTASADYVRLSAASLAIGVFLKIANFVELPIVSELIAKLFSKSVNDTASASDTPQKTADKALADSGSASDATTKTAAKSPTESLVLSDVSAKGVSKGDKQEGVTGSDIKTLQADKAKEEAVSTSDAASLTLSYSRLIENTSIVSHELLRSITKLINDSVAIEDSLFLGGLDQLNSYDLASTSDTGVLRSQGYADFTYFAEDYVGASRTF